MYVCMVCMYVCMYPGGVSASEFKQQAPLVSRGPMGVGSPLHSGKRPTRYQGLAIQRCECRWTWAQLATEDRIGRFARLHMS